jgi:hypothetical protein
MKRTLILAAGAALAAQASAQEAFKSSVDAGVDVSTAYIFRGKTVFDKPVAQPYAYATILEGLTIGTWANVALDDSKKHGGNSGDVSEVDLSLEYALPLGACPIGVALGYTEYLYPNSVDGDGTIEDPTVPASTDREVAVKFALATDCALDKALSPTLDVFYGLDGAIDKDLYTELGLSHELALGEGLSLGLGGTLGYLESDAGESGFSSATLSAGLGVGPAVLKVTYVIETDKDVLPVDEEVVGTLGLSKIF